MSPGFVSGAGEHLRCEIDTRNVPVRGYLARGAYQDAAGSASDVQHLLTGNEVSQFYDARRDRRQELRRVGVVALGDFIEGGRDSLLMSGSGHGLDVERMGDLPVTLHELDYPF